MSNEARNFTTPVGRLVGGSVSEPITKDFDGKPLTNKSDGKPTQRYNFSVAFAKRPGETHWSQSELGKIVWETGHAHMGQLAQREDFSFKASDGDSTKVNKRNRKPCENEGWPGHWVFHFSSSFPPSTYNADGSQPVPAESIKRGYFVQVAGSVTGNDNTSNPGVYLNHNMVALAAYGQEIKSGPDPKSAGFGQNAALPAGASTVPPAGLPPPAAPAAPPAPAPAAPLPPPRTAVQPSPSFIAPPAAPAAPPPPPAAPARVWKGPPGSSYEAYKAAGWSDEQMRANGLLG